ncbi:MAG: hypothetical protein ACLQIB_39115 [Isosphaeraceae bacterium]
MIDLLDESRAIRLEDLKHPVDAPVLDLPYGVLHHLNDQRVAQQTLLCLDVREDLIPDDGLEYGKEDQDGEVVRVFQAKLRAGDDRAGFKLLQLVVLAERALPREAIPMLTAESAEQLELTSGCDIPVPSIIEVHYSNRLLKASSNAA